MKLKVARLTSSTSGGTLRWTLCNGMSFRAYDLATRAESGSCVSTRSTELTIVLEGEVELDLGPARQRLRITPGEGCVVGECTPHRTTTAAGTRMVIIDLLGRRQLGPWVGHFPGHALRGLPLRQLASCWDQTLVLDDLQSCLRALDRPPPRMVEIEPIHNTRRMLEVKAFLEAHFAERIDMAHLASRFGLERHYMIREFGKNFGFPPLSYVNFLRVEHFAWSALLHGGQSSNTRAAQEAGFGDYATFCRRIKRTFGQSPSRLVQLF